jgi:hypothetical protein
MAPIAKAVTVSLEALKHGKAPRGDRKISGCV